MPDMDGRRWSEDYVAHVLRPAFVQAKRYLFKPLMLVNKAHAVMLAKVGLLEPGQAARLLTAVLEVEAAGTRGYSYREEFEDLYFAVEQKLIGLAGHEAGGNIQIARSRNDIDAAMIRIVLRETLLGAIEALADLRGVLIERALEHVDALMPGYTHNQPAQPTTLAHYLGAVIGCLERDARRLISAYATVNRNPLGAAALTTTGFPIRRDLTEALLGFEGLVENAIDAVGGADHILESVGAAATLEVNLSRFTFDLLTWSSREFGFLRVPDAFVQISSIMPQKRNPVVLEHIRAKLARSHGAAGTVQAMTRNVPYGDVNDVGETTIVPVLSTFTELDEAIGLLSAVLEGATFEVGRMEMMAGDHFTTATGLADMLVADEGLPFRTAHSVASRVVELAYARGLGYAAVGAALVDEAALARLGRPLGLRDEAVQRSLDPRAFVAARRLPGGPAREAMLPFLSQARTALSADESWRRSELARLRRARDRLDEAAEDLVEAAEVSST